MKLTNRVLLLTTLLFLFVPSIGAQDATDAQKQEFYKVFVALPTHRWSYTEAAIQTAGPYLPVLLSLNEKETGEILDPFLMLSVGLSFDQHHLAFVRKHFAGIRHPQLKLFWASLLFQRDTVSPEVVHYLNDALTEPNRAKLLSEMVGPEFKSFKRKVRRYLMANESGTQLPEQTAEDEGHVSLVTSVAFSPDSQRLLSGSSDGSLILWDTTTGRESLFIDAHRLGRHHFDVNSVAFASDGKTLASASSDKTMRLWDAATGAQLRVFTNLEDASYVTFSRDSRLVAVANCETVLVWNVTTGDLIRTLPQEKIGAGGAGCASHVEFLPDGIGLITLGDVVQLWDVTTGREIRRFDPQGGRQHMALSGDGKSLVVGADFQGFLGMVELWNVETGKLLRRLPQQSHAVDCVAFAPDGKMVATEEHPMSGSAFPPGVIKLWNTTTGAWTATLTGHQSRVRAIAFAPDGKTLASGSWDCSVKLWDVATGKEIRSFPTVTKLSRSSK